MNFTIGQQTLSQALNNLVRNTDSHFEVHSNIQIEVISENTIKLSAENGINKLEYTLEARNASGDPIMVNAKRFADIVNKLQDMITLHDNIIMCGKTKIKIEYQNGLNILPIQVPTEEVEQIDLKNFKSVIKNRLYAIDTVSNAVISNMYINKNDVVGTNGNVMSIGKLEAPIKNSFLLSQNIAKEIIADFKDDETINIAVEKNTKLIIWNDILKIENRLKEGLYPPYEQLIPHPVNTTKINKNELINKLDIMSVVVEFSKPVVKLVFNTDNTLTIENKDGQTIMDIDNYTGSEQFTIFFNVNYLISALKNTNADNIEFQLGKDSLSPAVIKAETDLHIIMPMQI